MKIQLHSFQVKEAILDYIKKELSADFDEACLEMYLTAQTTKGKKAAYVEVLSLFDDCDEKEKFEFYIEPIKLGKKK